ncbi:glutamate-5-semialdehyde dehydrogenase [Elusimicrobium posterum]|uniref:glutamate-5-semialdehyde dehydrogenase n=1 Tax=Elusimicrobium posterum TaxID=3116653 RepID=UPI003C78AF04
MSENIAQTVKEIAKAARACAHELAMATTEKKNAALNFAAQCLEQNTDKILEANKKDLAALPADYQPSFIDRLTLNKDRVLAMAKGLKDIAALPDPVGRTLAKWDVPSGLKIERTATPLGVIGVIFESRPNVCADAGALCLKSGNPVVLRGGADSLNSCKEIAACLQQGLEKAGLNKNCIQLIPLKEREAVDELLKQKDFIDVIIPRGGKKLVEKVSASPIPTFKHLNGICHTYVHKNAVPEMAVKVVINAKLRRTSICGATETLLIDKDYGAENTARLLTELKNAGCEIKADENILKLMPGLTPAAEEDWGTEYLDAIVSAKIVNGVSEAVEHIGKYSSSHTEAIITEDAQAAEDFLNAVDSAVVMHNASTQFCDGGEFGMGAEIGIATGRLHARGPVGLEQLCTFKYKVRGTGQTRA